MRFFAHQMQIPGCSGKRSRRPTVLQRWRFRPELQRCENFETTNLLFLGGWLGAALPFSPEALETPDTHTHTHLQRDVKQEGGASRTAQLDPIELTQPPAPVAGMNAARDGHRTGAVAETAESDWQPPAWSAELAAAQGWDAAAFLTGAESGPARLPAPQPSASGEPGAAPSSDLPRIDMPAQPTTSATAGTGQPGLPPMTPGPAVSVPSAAPATDAPGGESGQTSAVNSLSFGCCCEDVIPLVRLDAVDPTAAAWNRDGAHDTSTGAFEVWRTGDIGETLTVWYTVSEASTAVPGSDYEPLDGYVTIPAGERSAGILVVPIDNADENANKSVIITLDWSPDYLGDGATDSVTINETIFANLQPVYSVWPIPMVGIEVVDPFSAELPDEVSTGAYLVQRFGTVVYGGGLDDAETHTNLDAVAVQYTVWQDPNQISGDYQSLPGSVTLPAGVWAEQIPLIPLDDNLTEDAESIVVTLTPSESYEIGLAAAYGEVVIRDNDRPNQTPIANDDYNYEVTWNSTEELRHRLEVEPEGVLVNDGDLDGDPISVTSATTPDHSAEFDWCPDGSFLYVPEVGFVGDVTFTYIVSDGIDEDSAVVTIHVVDHAPVAVDDYWDVPMNGSLIIDAPGVLESDWDPDDDPLTAHLANAGSMQTAHGTIDYFEQNGSFKWTPDPGFTGSDSFQYKAFDERLFSNLATVFLTVINTTTSDGVRLRMAEYKTTNPVSYFLVTHDPVNNINQPTYSPPHWLDNNGNGIIEKANGDKMVPAGYVRGKQMTIDADFILEHPEQFQDTTLRVRGTGEDGIAFDTTQVTIEGNILKIRAVTSSTSLSPVVTHHDTFDTSWEVFDGTRWRTAGTSKVRLYVTFAEPEIATYETPLSLGCEYAQNATTQESVIEGAWCSFQGLVVYRKKPAGENPPPTQLRYYRWTWANGITNYKDLIAQPDGECEAWVGLWYATLKVQGGIDFQTTTPLLRVQPNRAYFAAESPNLPLASLESYFLVNNWQFSQTGTTGLQHWPFTNTLNLNPFAGIPGQLGYRYQWVSAEVNKVAGVRGQGAPNPRGHFQQHSLLQVAGKIYDPSYGTTYSTVLDWSTNALSGFAYNTTIELPPNASRRWIVRNTTSVANLAQAVSVFPRPGSDLE